MSSNAVISWVSRILGDGSGAKSSQSFLCLGAILAKGETASVLEPGTRGTTFGGNPVACIAGAAVLHELIEGGVLRHCAAVGAILKSQLEDLQKAFPSLVKEVRGFGLMLGVELAVPGDPLVAAMQDRGVLISCTDTTVLRFLPPLIIDEEHVAIACAALRESLASLCAGSPFPRSKRYSSRSVSAGSR